MNIPMDILAGVMTLLSLCFGVVTYVVNSEVKRLKLEICTLKEALVKLENTQRDSEARYHEDVREIFEAIKSIGREISEFKVSQVRELSSMDASIKKDLGEIKITIASKYVTKDECDKRSKEE